MVQFTSATVRWIGDDTYVAYDDKGHSVLIDAASNDSRVALRPTQLLMAAVGSCSAVDVVNILKKMKKELISLKVMVTGEREEGFPTYFNTIKVKYILHGKGITKEDAERAIKLSQEKYCSVSLTLAGKAKIDWEYEIIE
ncbi:MAG: OsmC family protein [Nitrososphaerota archaeon]